jgi:hypothetical protein
MKIIFFLALISVVTALRHTSSATGAYLAHIRVLLAGKSDIEKDSTAADPPRARKKPQSWQNDVYNDDDLKLKSGQFEVSVPSNINVKLTENEKKMIARKEEAEAAAREQQKGADSTMSDADILKAEMKAMLDRMRSRE